MDIQRLLEILRESIKHSPEVRWAFGLLGIAAVIGIFLLIFQHNLRLGFISIFLVFLPLFLLFIFSRITTDPNSTSHSLKTFFMWSVTLLIVAIMVSFVSSFIVNYPIPLQCYITDTCDCNSQHRTELEEKAEKGDPEAQHELATNFYSGGNGYTKDISRGVYWYCKASAQGYEQSKKFLLAAKRNCS
jgi:predicted membrane protein